MAQFKNLAPKIKKCRVKAPGGKLSQEKLASLLKLTRTAVTQWESKDERNRTEPNEEQLRFLANLHGEQAWWWLLWFMDDEISADRGVDYDNTGQRIALEPDWKDDDAEAQALIWAAEHRAMEEAQKPPEQGWLADAVQGKGGLQAIRARLAEPHQPQRPAEKSASNVFFTATLDASELTAPPRFSFSNLNDELRRTAQESQNERNWASRVRGFWPAVQHKLAQYIPNAYDFIDRRIERSNVGVQADYYDECSLIEFKHTQTSTRRLRLSEGMGFLLMAERLANRNLAKMLVICIDLDNPNENPKLKETIEDLAELGITLVYASADGEDRLAQQMSKFILAQRELRSSKKAAERSPILPF